MNAAATTPASGGGATERVAVVTGGRGAIGAATARRLAAMGARVWVADLPGTESRATAAADSAGASGEAAARLRHVDVDVASREAVEGLFDRLEAEAGRLDVLVHAAGITRDAVSWKLRPEDWEAVRRVNLDAAFLLVRRAVPLMRHGTGGAIVLVSSINAERGKAGQANYAASKAGLLGLARSVAREVGRFGIRVNVVAPGWIETPMTAGLPEALRERARAETALERLGQPEDVAEAIAFLASDRSRHITGQVLRVDGGQLMA